MKLDIHPLAAVAAAGGKNSDVFGCFFLFLRVLGAFGRVRPLPNIHSQNRSQRQFEERAAVNTFLQGTAAEILKKAMIAIDQLIVTQNLNAKMIIQVHDELVFDVHNTDVEALKVMVSQTMQSVVNYHIPLTVDMHVGNNWQLK